MDVRQESAIIVCIMYSLLIATCVGIALGLTTNPCTREWLLELPIYVQLLIAQAFGLTPVLVRLDQATHWTVPYLIIILSSYAALYRIGWWIGWLDDDRPER